MDVSFRNGVHLPELDLWLDPHHARASAFVTHAHADHMKPHGRVYATAVTAAIMRSRGATRSLFHEMQFGVPVEVGDARVTLLPAGHVLGSAQILVEHGGKRLLYSGDFKLTPGLAAEPIQVPAADIVVMESTFGRPRYRFPERAQVVADILAWCSGVLQSDHAPVLLCYSLGKGQEVLAGLAGAEFPIYLEAAHWKITEIYRKHGSQFPDYRLYDPAVPLDGVLLCGGNCRKMDWFGRLERTRSASISGWAVDGPWRAGTDTAFPLSDHADYDDLLEYVRLTGARTIYTLHGFDRLFAADLRTLGYDASPLDARKPAARKAGQLSLF